MKKLQGKRVYSWDDSISDLANSSSENSSNSTTSIKKIKQKSGKKIPTSFSIDEKIVQNLKNYCYWERKNVSQIVEELISNFLKKNGNDDNLKDFSK